MPAGEHPASSRTAWSPIHPIRPRQAVALALECTPVRSAAPQLRPQCRSARLQAEAAVRHAARLLPAHTAERTRALVPPSEPATDWPRSLRRSGAPETPLPLLPAAVSRSSPVRKKAPWIRAGPATRSGSGNHPQNVATWFPELSAPLPVEHATAEPSLPVPAPASPLASGGQ